MNKIVTSVEPYSDFYVAKGKLILIETREQMNHDSQLVINIGQYGSRKIKFSGEHGGYDQKVLDNKSGKADWRIVAPYVVSDIEPINEGDFIVNSIGTKTVIVASHHRDTDKYNLKVLANPTDFSIDFLQLIVDGKFKDGSDVRIDAEKYESREGEKIRLKIVKGKMRIASTKKKMSWEDVLAVYMGEEGTEINKITLVEYLKENYEVPKPIKKD